MKTQDNRGSELDLRKTSLRAYGPKTADVRNALIKKARGLRALDVADYRAINTADISSRTVSQKLS